MEQIATAIEVKAWDNIIYYRIRLVEDKYLWIKMKLILERKKIVKILKNFESQKLIKSVKRPKNKKMQKELDNLVKAKREIDRTLEFIKMLFK